MKSPPEKEKRPLGSRAPDSAESPNVSQSRPSPSTSIVEELRHLLGNDVVLLPIKRGNKGPSGKDMYGWENFITAKMQEPEYLARLSNGSNIGVKLGEQRATIDLDRDEDVEPFLKLNPKLRDTLRSRRKRGCNFWVRIRGDYPKSCKLKTRNGEDWGEWRADGNQTVIYGEAIDRKKRETEPTTYKIEHCAPPIELAFDEIRWPDELVLPWQNEPLATNNGQSLDELHRCYGQPYYSDENGNPRCLNESFWAGLFASENIILWEPSERVFYAYKAETGIYVGGVGRRDQAPVIRQITRSIAVNELPLAGKAAQRLATKQYRGALARHRRTSRCIRTTRTAHPLGEWNIFLRKRWRIAAILTDVCQP